MIAEGVAQRVLRSGLLADRTVGAGPGVPPEVTEALAALGATVVALPAEEDAAFPAVYAVVVALDAEGPAHTALDAAWVAVRGAVNAEPRPAKVVVLAPAREALRAAAENLARTLSIEWARFGVRTACVGPLAPAHQAALTAYLLSPAGDYFSGATLG
jgi:hypothetical protein